MRWAAMSRDRCFTDALDRFLGLQPVTNKISDGANPEIMLARKILQISAPRHRSVFGTTLIKDHWKQLTSRHTQPYRDDAFKKMKTTNSPSSEENGIFVCQIHEPAERWVLEKIRVDHPDWVASDGTCEKCFEEYSKL